MLPVHTILFPTDFSASAEHAFPLACALARDCGARIVVLHVALPPLGEAELEARRNPDEYYRGLVEALHKVQAPAGNVRVEYRLEVGDAVKHILQAAADVKAGLIVMGTHGRTGLGRLFLGSVAEQVLRKAACPVMTVKAFAAAGKQTT